MNALVPSAYALVRQARCRRGLAWPSGGANLDLPGGPASSIAPSSSCHASRKPAPLEARNADLAQERQPRKDFSVDAANNNTFLINDLLISLE